MAGHDFCSYNVSKLDIKCGVYTELTASAGNPVNSGDPVVKAVEEWSKFHPQLQIQYTLENFTRASLQAQGYEYDLVLTKTRNPSWFVYRPTTYCGAGRIHQGGIEQHPYCARKLSKRCASRASGLTLAVLYYGEGPELVALLEYYQSTWTDNQIAATQILIVDDGSPVVKAEDVIKGVPLKLSVCIAAIAEDLLWNIGGARNLAMFAASTDWVFLTDMDTRVPQALVQFALNTAHANVSQAIDRFPRVVNGVRIHCHPAVMLIRSDVFWEIGGHDEDFVGHYGYTDVHLRYRYLQKKMNVTSVETDPTIPPLEGMASTRRERNASFNHELFALKRSGQIPWSDDVLRFSWSIIDAS